MAFFPEKEKRPFVSVIVPVYNDERLIGGLLDSLLSQDYPKESFEIIVVDNNSNDTTCDVVRSYPVALLHENEVQSSYAARNLGVNAAKGDVIAFTDSDCCVSSSWLSEGVRVILEDSVDLIGGKVDFLFSEKKTAAEMYDSLTNLMNDIYVKERSFSVTANLIVRAKLFEKIGLFDSELQSGGDSEWTSRAVHHGYQLSYVPTCVVSHPARSFKELLKKRKRVAKGSYDKQRKQGVRALKILTTSFRSALPGRLRHFRRLIQERGAPEMNKKLLSIWCISLLCSWTSFCVTVFLVVANIFKGMSVFKK